MATSEFTIGDLMDLLVQKVGLPPAERAAEMAKMTDLEKADAYDYYVTHDQKAIQKAMEQAD